MPATHPEEFRRRAVELTAAGVKSYEVIDVPAELAWSIAAGASPWVAHNRWAQRAQRGDGACNTATASQSPSPQSADCCGYPFPTPQAAGRAPGKRMP